MHDYLLLTFKLKKMTFALHIHLYIKYLQCLSKIEYQKSTTILTTTYYIRAGLETIFLVDACECQPVKASRGRLPPSQARPRHILVFVARCSGGGGGGGGDQFASQTGTLAQAGPWTTSTTTTAVMAHCHSHHQGWEHSGFNQTQTSTQIKL